jgi:hypothetical protein
LVDLLLLHHSKISSEFWLAKVIRGTTASDGIVVFAVSQSAMLTLRISSKGERKLSTNDLDLDFPFFVVYIGLNAEPKKKEKGKKK